MREIKFRLWSERDHSFVVVGFPVIGITTSLILCNMAAEELKTIKIQQFAGFQDENGQDIYEGDIVRYKVFEGSMDSKEDSFKMTSEVKFENGAFYPRPTKFECEDSWYSWETFGFIKLGNIFENPELLLKK